MVINQELHDLAMKVSGCGTNLEDLVSLMKQITYCEIRLHPDSLDALATSLTHVQQKLCDITHEMEMLSFGKPVTRPHASGVGHLAPSN